MIEATLTRAVPCKIDAALVDRLYRKLTIALGHEAAVKTKEPMEPVFVDVSQIHIPGRTQVSRAVFRSSRRTYAMSSVSAQLSGIRPRRAMLTPKFSGSI